jgi:16S rRNA (guanine966-N2)-methyltransferase
MRVIGGELRSRVLKSVPGLDTRPTPDRLREALFNVLAPRIDGAVFADAYAGTGSVGIEALSRGAARAIFIEQSRGAVAVIRENLRTLRIESRAQVLNGRVSALLKKVQADMVFLDPPYQMEREYGNAMAVLAEKELAGKISPLVIVQHDIRLKLDEAYGRLHCTRTLRQGDNILSFYEWGATPY